MKFPHYICHRVSGCRIIMLLFSIVFITGCHRSVDPKLSEADAMMENHPDSALMFLESYNLPSVATDYDRAYYDLLLTHARFKNFIDETNDSIISASADYFLVHNDKELASRALFLQGMIQMNANRLGEAVVSFSKGLDMARDSKAFMWEGQCARGLYKLYGKLQDGSAQVEYAKEAYDAFRMLGDEDWISTSKYALAVAYNNNLKHNESLEILNQLEKEGVFIEDSLSLSHLYSLKGLSLFALKRYAESLESYNNAVAVNPYVLTESDKRNIQIAKSVYPESASLSIPNISIDDVVMNDVSKDAFIVYAHQGKYKEAYESIEAYKNRQDSVLSVIMSSNVSESLNNFRAAQESLMKKAAMNERLSYWLVILIVLIFAISMVWSIRERMHKAEEARLLTEVNMESLRADLLSQLDSVKRELENTSSESKRNKTIGFEKIIRQRYTEANQLIDEYYQTVETKKKTFINTHVEVNSIIGEFKDKESLAKIADYVDEKSGGLFSSFKKDFFQLSADSHRLFLYLILGLSARTLSVILDLTLNAVYIKKSRLKAKIEQSDVDLKNEYLKFF